MCWKNIWIVFDGYIIGLWVPPTHMFMANTHLYADRTHGVGVVGRAWQVYLPSPVNLGISVIPLQVLRRYDPDSSGGWRHHHWQTTEGQQCLEECTSSNIRNCIIWVESVWHPSDELILTDWSFFSPYSRQTAVYPLPWLTEKKFWPTVSRIDDGTPV